MLIKVRDKSSSLKCVHSSKHFKSVSYKKPVNMSDVAVLLILSVNRFAKVPAFSTVKLYSDCSPSSFKAKYLLKNWSDFLWE